MSNGTDLEYGILLDKLPWTKNPFTVRFGYQFKSYREVLEYQHRDKFINNFDTMVTDMVSVVAGDSPSTKEWKKKSEGTMPDNEYYKLNGADTTLGGNDAINCLWQFNRDDDLVHPVGHTHGPDIPNQWKGMSRVYSEMINDQQQLLWLGMGTPQFSGIKEFYTNIFDDDLVEIQNTGGETSKMRALGRVLGSVGTTAFAFPILAARWFMNAPGEIANALKGKGVQYKYYDFKMAMPLYYSHVNFILLSLAINMNLYNGGFNKRDTGRFDPSQLPQAFPKGKLDIYAILKRRSQRYNQKGEGFLTTTDDLVERSVDKDQTTDWMDRFTGSIGMFADAANDKFNYIGFRIEKSTDSSESISNSTGQSSISQLLNSKASEGMDKTFNMQIGEKNDANKGLFSSVLGGTADLLGGMASGAANVLSGGGSTAALNIMLGNGHVDIPEVWKESSFSKSYNFEVHLRSPYGDPLSIFQSIYVPLACLLAAALPRAVGVTGYTSPFIIRGYSKGMFSIPLGIIDSMSIRRGSSEHGWTYNGLPTCVDVSFTIKDLSPAMFLAIRGGASNSFANIFDENSTFQEYLATLSGFGLQQRLSRWSQIEKRLSLNWSLLWDERLNPERMAMEWGSGSIAQMVFAPLPFQGLSDM